MRSQSQGCETDMIFPGIAIGRRDHPPHAALASHLIGGKSGSDAVAARDRVCQNPSILQRHRRALCQKRQGRMCGIPQQRQMVALPDTRDGMAEQPPQPHLVDLIQYITQRRAEIGKGGAQAHYGVMPDLTCLGKIIGGGLPVGAYGGPAAIMDLVSPSGPVYQAGTLSGNPLAMTAGAWALSQLSVPLYKKLATLATRLASGLSQAARDAQVPLHVNGMGSVLTPFFIDRVVTDYDSATSANTAAYATFFQSMLDQGIYPPPSQFEGWFLSSAHTTRDIDRTIQAARKAMLDVAS